ncbi:MAG: hypothetical protein A2268_13730 [Candidatus Raymondbacteria bacterium RifOxyA12_full_50_37]|nr:MAG: hypothetical protein A2350_04365 [Candidatus Raymondbacteria bacterium RifOxyB12_full_50_8]OGJ91670.1 MAG: hypothetical protein A2268_13730 [Candidatus Raymondbacteria bacterium RifOxyA12_full_50_37]OGK05997.1 MAG: hypothetical protein A2487_14440 [Candidatus Raymondbacteria bacterium RifOxyC12_full_50_8]
MQLYLLYVGTRTLRQVSLISVCMFCLNAHCAAAVPGIDARVFYAINSTRNTFFNGASLVLYDAVWLSPVLYTYSLGYGHFKQDEGARTFGKIGLASTASSLVLVQTMKYVVQRERPAVSLRHVRGSYAPGLLAFLLPPEKYSCPSQTAALAASQAIVWGTAYPDWQRWLVALALLNGWAGIYEGADYPLDVVAGYAVGAGSAFAAMALMKTYSPKLDIRNASVRAPIIIITRNF